MSRKGSFTGEVVRDSLLQKTSPFENEIEMVEELLDYWKKHSKKWRKHIEDSLIIPEKIKEEFREFSQNFITKWEGQPKQSRLFCT